MLDFLLNQDFSSLFCSADIEFVWSTLKGLILQAISYFTPLDKLKRQTLSVWFDSNIRLQLHKLRSLRKLCQANPSPDRLHRLSFAEEKIRCDISNAKSTYESQLVSNFAFHNDSKIYRHIKRLSVYGLWV